MRKRIDLKPPNLKDSFVIVRKDGVFAYILIGNAYKRLSVIISSAEIKEIRKALKKVHKKLIDNE